MRFFIFLASLVITFGNLNAEVIQREGEGYLESREGQLVLHLSGTPFERGLQHGRLLKNYINQNIDSFINVESKGQETRKQEFANQLSKMMSHIPQHFIEEMKGIAEGASVPFQKILFLNLFPELFHCCGITVTGDASKDSSLYHVRVLDYNMGKNLQKTAVLMVVKAKERFYYLNVSYAGFIGSVTGMNDQKIAVGEIGGQGYGFWDGVPMAFLMREILENAQNLDDAKKILSHQPRTCEYYYLVSDGKTNDSFGAYATASQIHFIQPGTSYALLAPHHLPKNYGENGRDDKFFLSSYETKSDNHQIAFFQEDKKLIALFHQQPKDCLVMIGFSYPHRYPILIERILKNYGQLDEKVLQQVVGQPCSMDSNLHNAIFHPSKLKVWIAHASEDNQPACNQPYIEFDLNHLLNPSS